MAKDKPNLTVVPILNKQLKPKRDYSGKDAYQLYIRVFIGSKHTHMPISIANPRDLVNIYLTEQEFKLIEEECSSTKKLGTPANLSPLARIVQEIETRIDRLWDFHYENRLPDLKLTGLSKKLRYLYTPVVWLITQDVFDLVRNWLIESPSMSKLVVNGHLFSTDKSFEDAFEGIIGMYYDELLVFPTEIMQNIEFAFLFKAYSSERLIHSDVYSTLVLGAKDKFDEYLEIHQKALFEKADKKANKLCLPIRNKYSRFVSLFHPSADKYFYINKINVAKEKMFSTYKENLA